LRRIGARTLRSIADIGRLQRVLDSEADHVTPQDMLTELRADSVHLAVRARETSRKD
jgi:starvation-inducible DNA-binding protein